jgi:fatty acid desaturase
MARDWAEPHNGPMQTKDSAVAPATEVIASQEVRINWYRTKVDKAVMSELMKKSDAKALRHVLLQIGLYICTASTAFLAFKNIHAGNWPWTLPVFLLALFLHGTFCSFHNGDAGHELCHKTAFKTQSWNEFFLNLYAFFSWFDPVAYRLSHSKHHQFTTHDDLDGEVVLPVKLDIKGIYWFVKVLTVDVKFVWYVLNKWTRAALGDSTSSWQFSPEWMARIIPANNEDLRRRHRNWARTVLLGHLALAAVFIATGNWILVIIINLGCLLSQWLVILCNYPQHLGLVPNVPDFRLCTRTFTCSPFIGFLYWNMQYHVEHHMFPSVPFYNLPRLREALKHDLSPAPHGLWATWQEMWPIIQRQRREPDYCYTPVLPQSGGLAAQAA